MENYFEALKLQIDEIQGQDEATIKNLVEAAHNREYEQTVGSYAPIPRMDGRTQAQWQVVLNNAKATLLDPDMRRDHIAQLNPTEPIRTTTPEPQPQPQPYQQNQQSGRTIIKFRNGDEATSISQLVTLMEKNSREATDILYAGDLALGLAGAGETPFAGAARAVVNQFSGDRQTGLMAMVAVLRKTVKMSRGTEAKTPQQLARLIDQNWEESKTLLYNGFIALWLKYTNQGQLAGTVQKIVNTYRNDHDIGLEELVQRLDPQIGKPRPEVSQSEIDFGRMDTESQKTIQFSIKNMSGRGFLYGDVQLVHGMPGLQISNTEIQGDGVVTVELDASTLTAKQTHQGSLVVKTNGGELNVPISCYIDYPSQQSIQRIAISGFSLAAIALVARLIVQQDGSSGWLAPGLTGAGFTEWEQHWRWVEWFEWPWFEWKVYTLAAPEAGVGSVIGFLVLGVGSFAYWHFFLRKKSTH